MFRLAPFFILIYTSSFHIMEGLSPNVRMSRKREPPGFLLTKKGATWSLSAPILAPTESPKRFPKRSLPSRCRASPPVLLPVQRLPPPATAFPTPGVGCSSRATPCQGRARWAGGLGGGALVLALTGVAPLSSRTGGSYPLLVAGTESARAGSETSTDCPCRWACCKR